MNSTAVNQCLDDRYLIEWRRKMRAFARGSLFGKIRSVVNTSDVLQESLLQVWQNSESLARVPEASANSWGYKVVAGKIANVKRHFGALKRSCTDEQRNVDVGYQPTEPLEEIAQKEIYGRLMIAMNTLSNQQQTILYRVVFEDQPFAEVARQTGISASQVRRIYLSTVRQLQSMLSD